MSICQSPASMRGDHRFVWQSTGDGGGYWLCLNANCGEVDHESTGHQGG